MKFAEAVKKHGGSKLKEPVKMTMDDLGGVVVRRTHDLSHELRSEIAAKTAEICLPKNLSRETLKDQLISDMMKESVMQSVTVWNLVLNDDDGSHLFLTPEDAVRELGEMKHSIVTKLVNFAYGVGDDPLPDGAKTNEEKS